MNNFLIFFTSYFLIVMSCLGYGSAITKFSKFNIKNIDIGFTGIVGIFFLILYSYASHLFYAHTYIHNLLLLILGNIFFFRFTIQKFDNSEIAILFILFLILFIAFILFKTHDDFGYYHFPYTVYLTQNPLILGVGLFNHGFRTPSSIFYLNSLFYLPIVKHFMFHMGAILVMGFTNLTLLKSILNKINERKIDQIFYLKLLIFIFINIFFYRIAEHGTDRSAQILIFILIVHFYEMRFNYSKFSENVIKIFIIVSLVISLKSFYLLYLLFSVPIIYYLIIDKKKELIFESFKSYYFYLLVLMIFLNLSVYFFNTGCFIYPIEKTCFIATNWSIPISEVRAMNIHYEWWSKAGGGPGYSSEIPKEIYINFNYWFSNWIDRYFFNKVSDFLAGIVTLLTIIFFVFKSKKKE